MFWKISTAYQCCTAVNTIYAGDSQTTSQQETRPMQRAQSTHLLDTETIHLSVHIHLYSFSFKHHLPPLACARCSPESSWNLQNGLFKCTFLSPVDSPLRKAEEGHPAVAHVYQFGSTLDPPVLLQWSVNSCESWQ